MNKGLQWVLGICVVLLTLGWVFTMVAPFFITTPYVGMMGSGMMGGGMARFGGMGMGLISWLVLGGVGVLGFWLGRATAPKHTPPAA